MKAQARLENPPRFPRWCAHRGLSQACPENTLPAFGAALAAGAEELEFDLWSSRDGVAVVCHDETLERTTDGRGTIAALSWAELQRLDAGLKHGPAWRGLRLPRLEEVLDLAGGRMELNIHLKEPGPSGQLVRQVCDLLRERGLTSAAYIAGDGPVLEAAQACAPDLARACLADAEDPVRQIHTARRYACRRIQFGRHAADGHIRAARAAGLICNLFWSDEIEDARAWIARGIQVVLTNCAHQLIADGRRPAPAAEPAHART